MDEETTLGDIYEALAERIALAQTRALMGEREAALNIYCAASLEFRRFRDVLTHYPGFHTLEYAFDSAMKALCGEMDDETAESTDTLDERRLAA